MSKALYNKSSDIPERLLLGSLVFANLADMKVPAKDMETIFRSNGVPEKYVRSISPADAYRRATSSVKNKSINIMGDNGFIQPVRVEIDEVRCDSDTIKRVVGIKSVDTDTEDVGYESVGEIIFQRANNTCVSMSLKSSLDVNFQKYEDLMDTVVDRYNEWSVYHNKATVKNIITRIISDMHPVNLMPTGLCKFIPKQSSQDLYNLKAALYEMSAYAIDKTAPGNIMEIIPVVDTEEQRSLIEKNFQKEMTDELFGLTQDIKQKLSSNKAVSSRSIAAYTEKFRMLKDKISDYNGLMDIYTETIELQLKAAMDLVNDAMAEDSEDV